MDIKIINLFAEVIVNTFEATFNVKPQRAGSFQRLEGDIKNPDVLMCVLTFSGDFTGTLLLTFPENTTKKIYSELMAEQLDTIGDETREAFTEIMNMVSGNLTASLSDYNVVFDPPMIVTGKSKYENPEKIPWLEQPMLIEGWGCFYYLLSIKEEAL